jgi:hypothetical protein
MAEIRRKPRPLNEEELAILLKYCGEPLTGRDDLVRRIYQGDIVPSRVTNEGYLFDHDEAEAYARERLKNPQFQLPKDYNDGLGFLPAPSDRPGWAIQHTYEEGSGYEGVLDDYEDLKANQDKYAGFIERGAVEGYATAMDEVSEALSQPYEPYYEEDEYEEF